MAWGALVGGAIGAAGSLLGGSKKAKAPGVNIAGAIRQANKQAEDNIRRSIELENIYDPATADLRRQTNAALQRDLTLDTSSRDRLLESLIAEARGLDPLALAAYDEVAADLALGGQLDQETQNAVMRAALARTGGAGITGSRAQSGLVARDLGLTAEHLRQQRIQNAAAAGANAQQTRIGNLMTAAQGLAAAQQQDFARRMGVASVVEGRQRPIAGLDPASIVDLHTANANAAAQASATNAAARNQQNQGMWNSVAQMAGAATDLWTKRNKTG